MHARFFNRPILTSFVSGFVGGFRFSQMRHSLIELDPNFRHANSLRMMPPLITAFCLGLAALDPAFRLNRIQEHFLSTAMGFMLGSYLGEQTLVATPHLGPIVKNRR
jgi:hypothetical protein